MVCVPILTALTLVKSEPSTAGICAEVFNCKILLAAVPTSTLRVPKVLMLPPVRPVPEETSVTEPVLAVTGFQSVFVVFQPSTWPAVAAVAETALPCNLTALMLVKSEPSTAGICAEVFNCNILFAAVPTSTLRVPKVLILPPVRPVPEDTSVTEPVLAVMGSQSVLVVFQPSTCPAVAAVAETALPCNLTA